MFGIQKRRLGRDGPEVSAIGLGCMGMSEFYVGGSEAESIATIHHALDRGVTFLDTADMYGWGSNEELVGRAIADRRDEVFLATKFGNVRGPNGEFLGVRGDPEYVRSACEASLARLGVQTIDLYYQHRVDTNVPIEDTVGEMARLKDEGKIRFLGLSKPRRGRSAPLMRRRRSLRCRPSCRCGAATRRPRCFRRCASWASAMSLIRRSGAGS